MATYADHLRAAGRELIAAAAALEADHSERSELGRPFSQLDGERPSGCGKRRYLRAHMARRAVGDLEARCEGRARTMTAACWARFLASETGPKLRIVAPPQSAPTMLDRLGGRRS